jgi:hypothetical protein
LKVVLAAINARFTHSSPVLRYLRNAIEAVWAERPAGATGTAIQLREYHISQNRLDIVRDIVGLQPGVLMLSVYIWNADMVSAILPDLRALLPVCRIILGGPEVSYSAVAWLERHPGIDLIVAGAGESAVAMLAVAGFDTQAWPRRLLIAPPVDIACLPVPYRETDFVDLKNRYLYYESSRGCPFACSYCLSSREDQGLSHKPLDLVTAELDFMMAHQPMLIKFVDRTFNVDRRRARAIWQHLIARAPGTRFHFEVHPALLEKADFELLGSAPPGLFQFELGVQTVHAVTRQAIGRSGDWIIERDAIRQLVALKAIHSHVDMIVGLPGEDLAMVGRTFDELSALGADHFQIGFLKGLPGTRLLSQAAGFGMLFQAHPPYTVLQTAQLSSVELAELARVEELYDNIGNSRGFDRQLQAASQAHGGSFMSWLALSSHCRAVGFDIRTRNPVKIAGLLADWSGQ